MNDIGSTIVRIAVFGAGFWLSLWTIMSALRSFVLPRSDLTFLTTTTFRAVYYTLALRFKPHTPFATRDRILAMLSPIGMFMLPIVWLTLITIGYSGMYWAISSDLSWREAFILSGSSLMTLGFAYQDELPLIILAFSQAALSMMLIALLIGYLPTMYSAFSQREVMVTKLETFAGSPPSAAEMIRRLNLTGMLYNPEGMWVLWTDWQDWFVQIEENHTTLAPMNFFRSPKPDRHWVTAAGTVLDAAAIIASSTDVERSLQAALVLRSGYLALRSIADSFNLSYDPDPLPTDSIQVERREFDAVLKQLESHGVPVKRDYDECWYHFSGWRVNYDEVLIRLAWITNAPYARWSSDRAREWRKEDIPATARALDEVRNDRE